MLARLEEASFTTQNTAMRHSFLLRSMEFTPTVPAAVHTLEPTSLRFPWVMIPGPTNFQSRAMSTMLSRNTLLMRLMAKNGGKPADSCASGRPTCIAINRSIHYRFRLCRCRASWRALLTVPSHTIPCHTMPYHTAPHTMPSHPIPCHTIPCPVQLN